MKKTTFFILLISGFICSSQAATLYYSQTFNAESSQTLAAYNWVAHHGDSATAYPLDTTDTTNPYVVYATSGSGDDSGSGTANGYLYHANSLYANQRNIWWTNDFTPFDVSTLDSFQVDLRNSNTSDHLQFAFQIDGSTSWYRINNTFNPGTANVWSSDLTLNISEISAMDRLNVKPGNDFSTGSSGVSMPTSGNVTAFGIYNFDIDGNVRIDNFEVYVIPEPTSYMLIGISVAFLGLILRRRSHCRA